MKGDGNVKYQRLVFPAAGRCESEEADLDEQLGAGEVLIKNKLSLVQDGAELTAFCNSSSSSDSGECEAYYPGIACVGEVINGNEECPTGSRVFYDGPHAAFAKACVSRVAPVPEGISNERAVFVSPALAAMVALRLVPPRVGEQALVVGMGLTGNLCAQLLAQSGVGRVACADPSGARLGKAKNCGLIEVYDLSQKPLVDWVENLGPRGAEIVVEASGVRAQIHDAVNAVVGGGIVVLLAEPCGQEDACSVAVVQKKGVALVGANPERMDVGVRQGDQRLLLEWLRWEKLKVDPLTTQRMHFTEAQQAYEGLRDQAGDFSGVLLYY